MEAADQAWVRLEWPNTSRPSFPTTPLSPSCVSKPPNGSHILFRVYLRERLATAHQCPSLVLSFSGWSPLDRCHLIRALWKQRNPAYSLRLHQADGNRRAQESHPGMRFFCVMLLSFPLHFAHPACLPPGGNPQRQLHGQQAEEPLQRCLYRDERHGMSPPHHNIGSNQYPQPSTASNQYPQPSVPGRWHTSSFWISDPSRPLQELRPKMWRNV